MWFVVYRPYKEIPFTKKLFYRLLPSVFGIVTVVLSSLYLIDIVSASTCSWTGGVDSNWETAGNWTSCNGVAPAIDDDVLIDASVTVNLNAATTVKSLTLGNDSGTTTPVLNFAYDAIAGSPLTITDSATALDINPNAKIDHSAATGNTIVGKINIDITNGSALIDGSINVDGHGYPGSAGDTVGYGPGGGHMGNVSNGSGGDGAGYGGNGGQAGLPNPSYYTGGFPYGDVYEPDDLGSGGNGGDGAIAGGNGAGAIKLSAADTITVSGSISANGSAGTEGGVEDGGGGSGGSIWLNASVVAGAGTITSNGGNAGTSHSQFDGGGGAGGRIALYFDTKTFSGTLLANAAEGFATGGNGTIYLKDSSSTYGDLLIDSTTQHNENNQMFGSSAVLCHNDDCSGDSPFFFRDILIQNYV